MGLENVPSACAVIGNVCSRSGVRLSQVMADFAVVVRKYEGERSSASSKSRRLH